MARRQFRGKYHVIRRLLRLQKQGVDLSPAARMEARDPVYHAAIRLFGSYRQALVEAGINPLAVYQRRIPQLDEMRLHAPGRWTEAARIGRLIRERRAALGWSQARAADVCGLSESAIANYECGIRTPSAEAVPKLSRGLGIPAAELMVAPVAEERLAMLIELFDQLAPDDQVLLLNYAATIAGREPAAETNEAPTST